jgi:Mlc titration factor MtfA (ptsG expression regulator)/Flp pilus assembly protein TadD
MISAKQELFPEAWLPYLEQNVLLYRLLTADQQARLREAVRVFIADKFWEGCAGLQVTDEMRVTVAGHACLLVLGVEHCCFDDLSTILLYPGGFLGITPDPLGNDELAHRLGEAHHRGPVVVSWWQARWDGRRLGRSNLLLHEFAHKLAELGDPATGRPPLSDAQDIERWEEVTRAEYERLVEDADYQRDTLLDPYGATNRAEFFAVASECFFLQPIDLRRRHPGLYQLLADCYRQDPAEWPVDAALTTQAKAAEEEYLRHALAECDVALRLRPDSVDVYHNRANLYYELGDHDRALADYSRVLELAKRGERAAVYHDCGLAHFAAGSIDLAIADFTQALRCCRDFARAYCDRGAAYAAKGESDAAIRDLTHAIHLDPRDDQPYLDRGALYAEQGKHDKAVRDFTRAIRLAPHMAQGYSDRAWAYNLQHAYDQAIDDCNQAIAIDPQLAGPYRHRGVASYRKKQHDQALADLDEAIRLDPDYVQAYRCRARVYLAKGMRAEARRDLERARELR